MGPGSPPRCHVPQTCRAWIRRVWKRIQAARSAPGGLRSCITLVSGGLLELQCGHKISNGRRMTGSLEAPTSPRMLTKLCALTNGRSHCGKGPVVCSGAFYRRVNANS